MNGTGNEPNWPVELATLKRDVEALVSELDKLRKYVDRRFDKREHDVDRDFVDLKLYIKEQHDRIERKFDQFTPLTSFKPLVWWFRAIAVAFVSALFSAAVAVITWIINTLIKLGGSNGP